MSQAASGAVTDYCLAPVERVEAMLARERMARARDPRRFVAGGHCIIGLRHRRYVGGSF
jgi:hypothetical protein